MPTDRYILIGQTPVPCEDLFEWARWFEEGDRRVAETWLAGGDVRVSTVFLGLDHGFPFLVERDGYVPVLFETMTFDEFELLDQVQERCSTWLEAEAQHKAVARAARRELKRWPMRIMRLLHRIKERLIWMDRYRSRSGPYTRDELRMLRAREQIEAATRRMQEFVAKENAG